jgi:hypothetical protein
LIAGALIVVIAGAGCSKPPADPMRLEGNLLTVHNQSSSDWSNVEIWLNTHYRVIAPTLKAGGQLQVPLDTFVAGFGQRFNWRRAQIRDLRVTARLPDGSPIELKKDFAVGGLAGALGGAVGGKR